MAFRNTKNDGTPHAATFGVSQQSVYRNSWCFDAPEFSGASKRQEIPGIWKQQVFQTHKCLETPSSWGVSKNTNCYDTLEALAGRVPPIMLYMETLTVKLHKRIKLHVKYLFKSQHIKV